MESWMSIRQCARHKLNLELIAQGLANHAGVLKSSFFSVPLVLALSLSSIAAVNPPALQFEPIILSITLNMEQKGEFMVNMTKDGDFLIKATDLKAMGLRELPGTIITIDGEPCVSLRSMDEVKFIFDERKLSLDITVPPRLLPTRTIDFMTQRRTNVYYPKDSSAFLNYGLSYFETFPGQSPSTSITNELGVRTG